MERGARHLPVVLFVQISQGHRLREELIQKLHARSANLFGQRDRQLYNLPVTLNLVRVLVRFGLAICTTSAGCGLGLVALVAVMVIVYSCQKHQ